MQTKRVLALGFFDGVHIGHGALLRRTRQVADRLGCTAAVLTFDAPPAQVISGTPVALISTPADRARLMRQLYGIDEVLVRHFERAFMQRSWQDYIETLLLGELGAVHVVCGADHRFGFHGAGTAERLRAFCAARGVGCDIVDKVELDGAPVSSTRIRALLQAGELDAARRLLGHAQLLSGTVAHGAHRGGAIGFPTVNLPFPAGVLVPPRGVYCAQAQLEDGTLYPAVVNVGVHPTAGSLPAPILEAHLCGFDGDLYGQNIAVWLYHFLRPERAFSSMDALAAQIAHDRAETVKYFERAAAERAAL